MRQLRETLRLHLQARLSHNEVGHALKTSKSVVGKHVSLTRVTGVDRELAQTLSDEDLEAREYRPGPPRFSHPRAPTSASCTRNGSCEWPAGRSRSPQPRGVC